MANDELAVAADLVVKLSEGDVIGADVEIWHLPGHRREVSESVQ